VLVAGIIERYLQMHPRIHILASRKQLYKKTAGVISELIQDTLRLRNRCAIVLAGGSTPEGLYNTLAAPPYDTGLDWKNVYFFWGDERAVPPDHADSNYRMAYRSLLSKIPVPDENLYRIPAERPPADAAGAYEETIARFFGTSSTPSFDIILLGLGDDGHTASIFPGTEAIEETTRRVMDVYIERLRSYRITFSLSLINNAHTVIFLVSGTSKASVVREILIEKNPDLPASYVRPDSGNLIWMLDAEAGEHMQTAST
jgi:6-phosphogluconolactonase